MSDYGSRSGGSLGTQKQLNLKRPLPRAEVSQGGETSLISSLLSSLEGPASISRDVPLAPDIYRFCLVKKCKNNKEWFKSAKV